MTTPTQPRRRSRFVRICLALAGLAAVAAACAPPDEPSEEDYAKEEARQAAVMSRLVTHADNHDYSVMQDSWFESYEDEETGVITGDFWARIGSCGVEASFVIDGEHIETYVWREPLELDDDHYVGYYREKLFFIDAQDYLDHRNGSCSLTTVDPIGDIGSTDAATDISSP